MIIIGEKINATRKAIAAALTDRDQSVILETAKTQLDAGADFIDINGGDPREGAEAENVKWLVGLVQDKFDCALAIDTADTKAMRVGLELARKRPILNSISLESERMEPMLPICKEFDCMVVALLMDDNGTPCGIDDRYDRAGKLIDVLTAAGKKTEDIIIDPCFLPVASDMQAGRTVIDAIAKIHQAWPDVHIGGGCSNISFGLPQRKQVNMALLAQAIYHGMDTGLINPCVPGVMEIIYAAEAVAGCDEFCMNYVTNMKG